MKFAKYLLVAAGIMVVVLAGCSKRPATIKGRVIDSDGNALAGAAVFTVPQQFSTLTDSAGFFLFEDIPPGEYSLLAKFDSDSTAKLIGALRPGEVVSYDMVIYKAPPPPPPPPPDTVKKEEAKPAPPPEEPPVIDPAIASGASVIHLGSSELFRKFEVESSDGLVWTLKKGRDSKLKFQGGRLNEGYFAGPYYKYWETAARRLEYDGRIWIYIHGPEAVVAGSRAITIGIPLSFPANAEIDSVVVEYGLPRFPDTYTPGDVQLRLIGETASDITVLMDWQRVDHAENGLIKKQVIPLKGANRKLEKINIEADSDGDAAWDDLMVRPLVYFQMR